MKKMPMKMLFLLILIFSTILALTANSWISLWMGMEINLMGFIPMMHNQKNNNSNLSSIKYFIVQSISSLTLMLLIILWMSNWFHENEMTLIIMMTLSVFLKIGAAPFHFWFPEVMEYMSWSNCALLLTWQKIAPMAALMYLSPSQLVMTMFIVSSALIGAIMGLNQVSLRLILSYSSINHIGWMVSSTQVNFTIWMYYFMIYSILTTIISLMFKSFNINSINELYTINNKNKFYKMNMMMAMLSLGGMPPLLGFLPKWMLVQELMNKSMFLTSFILTASSTITLYFYMKLFVSAGFIYFHENKWTKNQPFNKFTTITMYLNLMSTLGLTCSSLLI